MRILRCRSYGTSHGILAATPPSARASSSVAELNILAFIVDFGAAKAIRKSLIYRRKSGTLRTGASRGAGAPELEVGER